MAEPRKKRRKERADHAPAFAPELAKSADFPEEEVHARARATVRGLFRKNLELVGRKP